MVYAEKTNKHQLDPTSSSSTDLLPAERGPLFVAKKIIGSGRALVRTCFNHCLNNSKQFTYF